MLDWTTLENTDRTLVSTAKGFIFWLQSWVTGMDVGREANPSGFYKFTFPDKIFIKKVCFLNFEEEKTNFTTFGPSLKNCWKHPVLEFSW